MFFIDGLFAAKIVFISILPSGTSANGGGFCLEYFFYRRNFLEKVEILFLWKKEYWWRDWFSEFVMQLSEKYAIFAPNKNQTFRRDKNREEITYYKPKH